MSFNYAFMTFSTPELSWQQVLDVARKLGYAGVEPRTEAKHDHGIEPDSSAATRQAARQTAADAGIAIACIATSCKYADPVTTAAMADNTRRHVDLAADLGCPRLRIFGGALGEGLSRQDAIAHVADALRPLGEYAAARDVTLCLETHDAWTDPADVVALMQRVDHPAVAVNWDIMHPVRASGYTMADSYIALAPWIQHVHVHDGANVDGKLELRSIGHGIIDHTVALDCLQRHGYTGYISGEWINWQPWEEHLPRELALLRAIEADLPA